MRDIASHAPRLKAMCRPKASGNRRSGRAGEPAAGESVGASESLADAPHRPRLPSCPPVGPTHRLPDLYGSLSRTFGISWAMSAFLPLYQIVQMAKTRVLATVPTSHQLQVRSRPERRVEARTIARSYWTFIKYHRVVDNAKWKVAPGSIAQPDVWKFVVASISHPRLSK